jgi:uncharacterized Zn finger protein (UPF0148 family)
MTQLSKECVDCGKPIIATGGKLRCSACSYENRRLIDNEKRADKRRARAEEVE